MRNFFLRQVLENIRRELGFGVQPNNADEVNSAGTIKQEVGEHPVKPKRLYSDIPKRLRECYQFARLCICENSY